MNLVKSIIWFCWIFTAGVTEDSRPCQNMLNLYRFFLQENPLVVDAPFGYEPNCEKDGRFQALQRHAFYFFCVDTITGEKIPETDYEPGKGKAITEKICQEYSDLWQKYNIWMKENNLEELNEQHFATIPKLTCPEGFEFHLCNCKNLCTPGSNMSKISEVCDDCKAVCRCPDGFYEYNKTCVSNEACMAMEPEPYYFDMRELLWNTYMLLNSNDVLKNHWEAENENNLQSLLMYSQNEKNSNNSTKSPHQNGINNSQEAHGKNSTASTNWSQEVFDSKHWIRELSNRTGDEEATNREAAHDQNVSTLKSSAN